MLYESIIPSNISIRLKENHNTETKCINYSILLIKQMTMQNISEGVEEMHTSYIAGRNVKQHNHFGEYFGIFSQS